MFIYWTPDPGVDSKTQSSKYINILYRVNYI